MERSASGGMARWAADRAARDAAVTALCLTAVLTLGACGPRRDQAVPVASAADLPAAATESTETAALPAAPDATAPEKAESYASAEPANPNQVMGLTSADVQALLGEPGLVRHESPAEVWQYQSRGCVLDVFMYRAESDYQVVYVEARDGQAAYAVTAICLGSVMDERRRMPTS